jgi:hypothetical protein
LGTMETRWRSPFLYFLTSGWEVSEDVITYLSQSSSKRWRICKPTLWM